LARFEPVGDEVVVRTLGRPYISGSANRVAAQRVDARGAAGAAQRNGR
jgi:hypothetical protein